MASQARRPMLSSSDITPTRPLRRAPTWIVLQDAASGVRGVVDLDTVQDCHQAGRPTSWQPGEVSIPITVAPPLHLIRGPLDR